jgi:glycolate oxidase FAD binding subunit
MTPSTTQLVPLVKTVVPGDEAEVADVLREAAASKTAVYPIGGGTTLAYGVRPTKPGIGLFTASLNQLIDHSARDLTITVDAGMSMSVLSRHLAAEAQWLPIDVSSPEQATIGGVLAANAFGPRRYAYGTIRDYVLGIRAVDGRGAVFAGGGRVVKNAAGYNIPRLLVGSFGTLGVITEVTLLAQPLPQSSALVVAEVSNFDTAECLLAGLSRTQTLPVAIELLAGQPRAGCPLPPLRGPNVARLIVGFDGNEAEVQWMARQLAKEWKAISEGPPANVTGAQAEKLWNWLADCRGEMQINVLPGDVVGIAEEVLEMLPESAIQAHAGNGVARVFWSPSAGAPGCEDERFAGILRQRLRPAVANAGGTLAVLACPDGAQLDSQDIWGLAGKEVDVMKAIRERFDPEGILNPGRFPFGC